MGGEKATGNRILECFHISYSDFVLGIKMADKISVLLKTEVFLRPLGEQL